MTFEERMAELGVDLSDLPRKWMACASEPYSGEQCYKAHGAAWAWYVGEDQRAVPELEQQETTRDRMILRQYILHLTDIIDRMETRLDNCPLRKVTEPKPRESRKKLPCPKCGSKRLSIWCYCDKDGKPIEAIACDKCKIASAWSRTTIGAIRDWNKVVQEWTE